MYCRASIRTTWHGVEHRARNDDADDGGDVDDDNDYIGE